MSLEAALAENTAAINNLAKLFMGGIQAAPAAAPPPAKPEPVKVEPAKAAAVKDGTPSFDSVKGPFVALVNTNRAAASAILAQFKIAKLSDATAEQYADILAAVRKVG